MTIADHIQRADWKNEKHVPVIICPDTVAKGEPLDVEVVVGKSITHPNTTEHHIRWIQLFFKPVGGRFVYEVAKSDFGAHGDSTAGANAGPVHTDPATRTTLRLTEPGTLMAVCFCNIHGLWESQKEVSVP